MRMDPETKYRVASCLVVLCLVACVLGFAAICIAIPRIGDVDLDYMGVIVGILSILVTVLIGWNIYTIVDFNKIKDEQNTFQASSIKKINEMEVSLNKKIENGIIESHKSMVLLYNSKGEEMNEDDEFFILFHYLSILIHQSKIGMIKDCNRTIDAILFTVGDIQVPLYRNDAIQNLLGEIENKNMISKWQDLAGFIKSHIKVIPMGNTNQDEIVKANKKSKKRNSQNGILKHKKKLRS